MENDFKFWDEYLKFIKEKILKLCKKQNEILVDLHIHTNHSADGKQTLEEIIKESKKYGFEIIAITDHDSLDSFDDLYNYLIKHGFKTNPIIIPGIEHTTNNREYGNQCHILQYMINPKEEIIQKDVEISKKAMYLRAKRQIERIKQNKALNYFFEKYQIDCNYEDFTKFLKNHSFKLPEYSTLIDYLMFILKPYDITVIDIFDKLEEINAFDNCLKRKELKAKRYKELRIKYKNKIGNETNPRLLLSILAPREVDDDWFEGYESSGSLSVNNYNQLTIEQLNDKYLTIFAHPNIDKFDCVIKAASINKKLKGIEHNYRSKYKDTKKFYRFLNKNNFILVKGSDSHELGGAFYEELDFYKLDSNYLKRFLEQ